MHRNLELELIWRTEDLPLGTVTKLACVSRKLELNTPVIFRP